MKIVMAVAVAVDAAAMVATVQSVVSLDAVATLGNKGQERTDVGKRRRCAAQHAL